ncbi:MAG: hypothetical protein ACM65M_15080 [Microcoleus sp.]
MDRNLEDIQNLPDSCCRYDRTFAKWAIALSYSGNSPNRSQFTFLQKQR